MTIKILKQQAAEKALDFVEDNMRLGIGTGSTTEFFIEGLAEKIQNGLNIKAVTTSIRSENLCQKLGIKTYSLNDVLELDLTIDGADEISPDLTLVKGGGGALLHEKIIAFASKQMFVIADYSKMVQNLGRFPLPIEVNPFGFQATKKAIKNLLNALNLHGELTLRKVDNEIFISDGGHYILDASLTQINNVSELNESLLKIPGVVEHGLFIKIAKKLIIAMEDNTVKIFE